MADGLSAYSKKRKSLKIFRYVFLGILVAALLGTALYFSMENYFVIKDVKLKKSGIYETSDIIKTLQIKKNTPLYRFNRKKVVSALEGKYPYIFDVKVKYKLPQTVQITFQEEYGEMALMLGDDVFAVDRKLFVLAKEPSSTKIRRIKLECTGLERCVVGESLKFTDEGISPGLLNLLEELEKSKMLSKVTGINISDKFNIKMNYQEGLVILLGDQQDIELKLAMVREVIKELGGYVRGRIDISDPDNAYVKLEG